LSVHSKSVWHPLLNPGCPFAASPAIVCHDNFPDSFMAVGHRTPPWMPNHRRPHPSAAGVRRTIASIRTAASIWRFQSDAR